MKRHKKFEVVEVWKGWDLMEREMEEVSLEECVRKVFSEEVGKFVEKNNSMEYECGFKIENDEGHIRLDEDWGLIVREIW